MTPESVLEIANQAIMTLLWVTMPIMAVALVSGLIIALFQALTSVQEMTLTFVPKIILVFVVLLMIMPWMADKMNVFTINLFDKIVAVGGS
ncbi:MAG: flagellar biosynthetic protein FliQ [Magnetococcales bacterium]|nr:flagellar biosynthetic protein FliQ [Magnetococcales bacterium]|tara:strand:+ start:509699 stop:509971 length:273 start_codon:yes stop_codon:yes gene_type:complete